MPVLAQWATGLCERGADVRSGWPPLRVEPSVERRRPGTQGVPAVHERDEHGVVGRRLDANAGGDAGRPACVATVRVGEVIVGLSSTRTRAGRTPRPAGTARRRTRPARPGRGSWRPGRPSPPAPPPRAGAPSGQPGERTLRARRAVPPVPAG